MEQPLADRIRPQTLDEVVGQRHLLAPGALLRRFIDGGSNANMIFYGPSGVGKTTVANIIAQRTKRPLYRLNATNASTQDIRDIMADIGTIVAPNGVLLYLDEIQYFNKRQQQSLLEFMENGKITLIASTTENPYFCVFNALLSRSTVFEFKALTAADVAPAVERGLAILAGESHLPLRWEEGVVDYIASACGGDVRKALNALEFLYEAAEVREGALTITLADAQSATQRSAMRYDREGDNHYDLLSALQKSIRGSDPDAAVHYLAKLLVAGDLLSPCRRLLVIAAEDIGLAYPMAIPIVKACVDSALQSACRRPACLWPTRPSSWPRPPSPTPGTTPSSPPCRTWSGAAPGMCPGTFRMFTRTPPAAGPTRGTSTPTCSPAAGWPSSTSPTR